MRSASDDRPFEAYRTEVVVNHFPRRIESICIWGELVLAGLQDGSLLYFKRVSDASKGEACWQVVKAHKDVERKAILQMEALHLLPPPPATPLPPPATTILKQRPGAAAAAGGSGLVLPPPSHAAADPASEAGGRGPAGAGGGGRALLLSLTEDGINLRSLPDAMLRYQALQSRGASCFAWSRDSRTRLSASTSPSPAASSLLTITRGVLAVAVKRRVQLYAIHLQEKAGSHGPAHLHHLHHAHSSSSGGTVGAGVGGRGPAGGARAAGEGGSLSLVMLMEVAGAGEAAAALCWAGTSLFLATKRAYYLLAGAGTTAAAAQGGAAPPPDPTPSDAPPSPHPLPPSPPTGPTHSASSGGVTPGPGSVTLVEVLGLGVGAGAAGCVPALVLCPASEEVLLAQGCGAVAVNEEGKITRRAPLMFSEQLVGLAAGEQYALGLMQSGVEIRSLRRAAEGAVVQRLPELADARLVAPPGLAPDGSVFLGLTGDKGIRRLLPVPLCEQAEALARAGEYREALALAALVGTAADTGCRPQPWAPTPPGLSSSPPHSASVPNLSALLPPPSPPSLNPPGAQGGPPTPTLAAAAPAGEGSLEGPGPGGLAGSGSGGAGGAAGVGSGGSGGAGGAGYSPAVRRQALEDRLRLLYAYHLYGAGEHDEGMAQLALCSPLLLAGLSRGEAAGPRGEQGQGGGGSSTGNGSGNGGGTLGVGEDGARALLLLRLLPFLVAPKFQALLPTRLWGELLPEVQGPAAGPAQAAAAAAALPYLTSHRSRIIAAAAMRHMDLGGRAVRPAPPAPPAPPLLAAQQLEQQGAHNPAQMLQQAGGQGNSGMGGGRGGEGAAGGEGPAPSPDTPPVTPSVTPGVTPGSEGPGVEEGRGEGETRAGVSGEGGGAGGQPDAAALRGVLQLVDTALVGALLAQPEDCGALLRLVQQQPHWIDLAVAEQLLSARGMYAELAALYKYKGEHEKGLHLLYLTSQRPKLLRPRPRGAAADLPGLPGVWAAVRYMTSLGEEHADIITRHSRWILLADPEAGLQAFLQMCPPLNPSMVLDILHQHSPDYCSMYLETALEMGVALPQDYHAELLLIYLRDILKSSGSSSSPSSCSLSSPSPLSSSASATDVETEQGPASNLDKGSLGPPPPPTPLPPSNTQPSPDAPLPLPAAPPSSLPSLPAIKTLPSPPHPSAAPHPPSPCCSPPADVPWPRPPSHRTQSAPTSSAISPMAGPGQASQRAASPLDSAGSSAGPRQTSPPNQDTDTASHNRSPATHAAAAGEEGRGSGGPGGAPGASGLQLVRTGSGEPRAAVFVSAAAAHGVAERFAATGAEGMGGQEGGAGLDGLGSGMARGQLSGRRRSRAMGRRNSELALALGGLLPHTAAQGPLQLFPDPPPNPGVSSSSSSQPPHRPRPHKPQQPPHPDPHDPQPHQQQGGQQGEQQQQQGGGTSQATPLSESADTQQGGMKGVELIEEGWAGKLLGSSTAKGVGVGGTGQAGKSGPEGGSGSKKGRKEAKPSAQPDSPQGKRAATTGTRRSSLPGLLGTSPPHPPSQAATAAATPLQSGSSSDDDLATVISALGHDKQGAPHPAPPASPQRVPRPHRPTLQSTILSAFRRGGPRPPPSDPPSQPPDGPTPTLPPAAAPPTSLSPPTHDPATGSAGASSGRSSSLATAGSPPLGALAPDPVSLILPGVTELEGAGGKVGSGGALGGGGMVKARSQPTLSPPPPPVGVETQPPLSSSQGGEGAPGRTLALPSSPPPLPPVPAPTLPLHASSPLPGCGKDPAQAPSSAPAASLELDGGGAVPQEGERVSGGGEQQGGELGGGVGGGVGGGEQQGGQQPGGGGRRRRGHGPRQPTLYQRLRDLVFTSPYIDPNYVLTKLPSRELPEIRALMLERLGRHPDALDLYCHELHDLAAAEAYCDRVYEAEVKKSEEKGWGGAGSRFGLLRLPPRMSSLAGPEHIYVLLLQAILGPNSLSQNSTSPSASLTLSTQLPAAGNNQVSHPTDLGSNPGREPEVDRPRLTLGAGEFAEADWDHDRPEDGPGRRRRHRYRRKHMRGALPYGRLQLTEEVLLEVARLLSRKRDRLDPLQVLELLPDGVPLHLMLPWVEAVVQAGTQAKRNMAVVKHLRRAENLAVREELARLKSGRVVLSSERACCLCFKRIGPAVFVAYPDMTLAHYLCHKRSQPSAAHVPGAGNLLGGSGLSAGLSLAGLVGSAGLPANGRKATSRPYTGGYAGGNDGYDYPDLL